MAEQYKKENAMKNIIWMLPLAGALSGLALSYLVLNIKFRMVPQTLGYSRKNYSLIESFDLKASVFSTLIILTAIALAAGGYQLLMSLKPDPEPGKTPGFIPIPLDTIMTILPPPPPIDPEDNFKTEPLPAFIKTPSAGRIVPVDSVNPDEDLTNNQALDYYARRTAVNDTMLKYIRVDSSEIMPEPGTYVNHDKLPVLLNSISPVYPSICKSLGIEGRVVLNLLVDKNGQVVKIQVLRSSENQALDEAAIESLKQARFSPARQGDRPVAVWLSYPVVFKIN
jgi:protein TonB